MNYKLSYREREVVELIAYEYTSKQIAEKLCICIDTVQSHRKNILAKLGAKNTAGMIFKSIEAKIIKLNYL